MKTRSEIAAGEKVEHKGDLTIENNIGAGAELKITNGSLIIKGDIGQGAKIELIAPENKKIQNNNMSTVSFFGRGISIVTSSGGFTNSISADTMINNNTYIGHVNINNRIFSNDQVSKVARDTYRITPSQFSSLAHATIDGIEYKGSDIVVNGKEVLVNGKKPSTSVIPSTPELELPLAKIFIHGSIGNKVTLISGAETTTVEKNIGSECQITCPQGKFTGKNVGNGTHITAYDDIKLDQTGVGCLLTSTYGSLEATRVGASSLVNVREKVEVKETIGAFSHVMSSFGSLHASQIESNVTVKVRNNIEAKTIGHNSSLTSEYAGLVSNSLGQNVTVQVRDTIRVGRVGKSSHLISDYGTLAAAILEETVNVKVRNDAEIAQVQDHCRIVSEYGNISITELSGNHVTLEARKNLVVNHIGSHARLTSNYGSIVTGNVGSNSTINARSDIHINGSCPRYVQPHSSYGRVYKHGPTQEYKHPETVEQDIELEIALAQSLQDEKTTFDTKPVAPNMNDISQYNLSLFSEYTKAYIQSFKHIEKNSLKIKALNLSGEDEEKLCEGLVDALTDEIPEIPVRLNEKLYNLKTLVFDLTKKGEDPFTRFKFKLEHIMPAHDVQEELNKRIKKLEVEKAKMKSENSAQLFSKNNLKENDLVVQKENDVVTRNIAR